MSKQGQVQERLPLVRVAPVPGLGLAIGRQPEWAARPHSAAGPARVVDCQTSLARVRADQERH